MRIALCQLNVTVGDIAGNSALILAAMNRARAEGVDIAVFSEMVICAYPAEDLWLRDDFLDLCEQALARITDACQGIAVVIGHPQRRDDQLFNACSFIADGQLLATYCKQKLPNYRVFDEQRYFQAGGDTVVVPYKGGHIGLLICEDLWHEAPLAAAKKAGAQLIISPNGSPWHREQVLERNSVLEQRVQQAGLPIIYVNQVGGQDELIFDGRSQAWNTDGAVYISAAFAEDFAVVEWHNERLHCTQAMARELYGDQEIYQAIVISLRDYIQKNGFRGVILGLSGGIDSALTLALAVDAIGATNVRAVMMPYRYTAAISIADARKEAELLGVAFDEIEIGPIVEAFQGQLAQSFSGTSAGVTEQNLQARSRGSLLMALSNKFGYLVLTTGNKSEVSVGYSTLYGDMAGGFDVLKDVPKMLVYRLSRYRNSVSVVIPQRVIERPPSAELAPDQKDEDNLPPYEILDQIIEYYVEQDMSAVDIISRGFATETVYKVLGMIDRNEYKRRQSAPGPRISHRAFGRDRRYPITSRFFDQIKPQELS